MTVRLLHYSDVENAYDSPERIGRLAGTVQARRDERTLVVGTGDNTGPGVLADRHEGRQALTFFEAIDTDAETFGNHDFDYGPAVTSELVEASPQTWVSANVAPDDERFADVPATAVFERAGERVGLVGVTDPALPDICPAAAELETTEPVAAVRDALPSLRERDVDHVVVLSHLRDEHDHAIASHDAVDVVLGGHVHRERHERVEGTLLLRPGANGEVVWEVELGESATATRRSVADGPLDEWVREALHERLAATGLTEVVGTVEEPIVRERDRRYGGECRAANLVTDAYRWATGADVGFVQSGSVRDGPALAGDVTAAEVMGVSPFAGELDVVTLSGAELRETVATVYRGASAELTWHGHFSGLKSVVDGERVREVSLGGEPVDDEEKYALATNSYVVQCIDEMDAITPDRVVDTWGVQYDAMVAYVRENGFDVGPDGRVETA